MVDSSPRETLGRQMTAIQNKGYSGSSAGRVTRAAGLKEETVCRGVKLATLKCLSGMRIISSGKQSGPQGLRTSDLSTNCLKNRDRGPAAGRQLSHRSLQWERGVWAERSPAESVKALRWVPLPLPGPASVCLPTICFSILTSTALLFCEVPNPHPQHPPVSLAEDGI